MRSAAPSGKGGSMLECREGEEFRGAYPALWAQHKKGFTAFSSFDLFQHRLVNGNFLLLQNRFELRTLALLKEGIPILLATLFLPKAGWNTTLPASIGALAANANLHREEAIFFWRWVAERYAGTKIVGPLNGHHYLGFSLPELGADPLRVGFQTASPHRAQKNLFGAFEEAKPYRTYHSFETQITPRLVEKLRCDLAKPKCQLKARPFNPLRAKRDFSLLNRIVNASFTEHFDFAPITDEENWDIFRFSLPLLHPQHLLFLENEKETVGFCLGMRDYNRVFRNDADWRNLGRLPFAKPERARLIHIGILPQYRGQGLVKEMRHRVLLRFAKEGIQAVENSYMDEANVNSLSNVKSTGAKPLHLFHLYELAR